MPDYMLDTDIVIFVLRGRHPEIDRRIGQLAPSQHCISMATYAELMFGIQHQPSGHVTRDQLARFLDSTTVLDLGREAAEVYARLRYRLNRQGMPIESMDLLIAAHAISIGAILVTNNVKHFERLAPDLTIENWIEN